MEGLTWSVVADLYRRASAGTEIFGQTQEGAGRRTSEVVLAVGAETRDVLFAAG